MLPMPVPVEEAKRKKKHPYQIVLAVCYFVHIAFDILYRTLGGYYLGKIECKKEIFQGGTIRILNKKKGLFSIRFNFSGSQIFACDTSVSWLNVRATSLRLTPLKIPCCTVAVHNTKSAAAVFSLSHSKHSNIIWPDIKSRYSTIKYY